MTETKIRVAKSKLIDAIMARRAEAVTEYEEAMKTFDERMEAWKSSALDQITRMQDAIRDGKEPAYTDRQFGSPPTKRPIDTTKYDRHIAMLEMSPDDTISVNATDFGAYLR